MASPAPSLESLQPKRLRNPQVTILDQILIQKAKLDKNLETENNGILSSFLDSFIAEMKASDKVFESLFQKVYYTGSYYSDLRIKTPDEFDLNLVLKMPKGRNEVSKHSLKEKKKSGKLKKNKKDTPTTGVVYNIQKTTYPMEGTAHGYNELFMNFTFQSMSLAGAPTTELGISQKQPEPYTTLCPKAAAPKKRLKSTKQKQEVTNERRKFRENGMLFEYNFQVPSFMKYKVLDRDILDKVPGLSRLFEEDFLIPEKVRKWLQSVVDKALRTYIPPVQISKVTSSAAGPARTIKLHKRNGGIIDIDLVPVIQCSPELKPPGITSPVYIRVKDDLECFLVPKPYQPKKQAPISKKEQSRLWRAHYPDAENKILYDRQCVNNIIRLLKLLRDKEINWSILASYYLKTIVMWMIIDHPEKIYWTLDKMGERFVEALQKLQLCIQARKIKYIFISGHNLLEKISDAEASNIQNRLAVINRKIEMSDFNLWEIFDCRPTFTI